MSWNAPRTRRHCRSRTDHAPSALPGPRRRLAALVRVLVPLAPEPVGERVRHLPDDDGELVTLPEPRGRLDGEQARLVVRRCPGGIGT